MGRETLRHALIAAGLPLAAAVVAAACDGTTGEFACFESGGTQYSVHVPGDTSLVFRWPASHQPVRIYAEPVADLPANVVAAIALWEDAFRCGELSFTRVFDSTTADVIFRNPPQLPALMAGAVAFPADSVGACRGRTDVLLDSIGRVELPMRVYVTPFNIDTVAVNACYHFVTAHEMGHALGLFSHSPDNGDLMFSTPRRRVATVNDRFTIQLLYHLPSVPLVPEPR